MKKYKGVWTIIYAIYPPFLRFLEVLKIHRGRQGVPLGFIKKNASIRQVKSYLIKKGFEKVVLAWEDDEEVLSMRKIYNDKFQHHIRIFNDKEVRAHDEYSSEGNPSGHIFKKYFIRNKKFFKSLMKDFLA